jgi:hypothetical protein
MLFNETLYIQGIRTFSKIHIYSKMMKKKTCHVFGQLQTFLITSCKKTCSKIHSYDKVSFGKKDMWSFFFQ